MADISNELHNIMNARYGKDVRQSIHDGLEKMNRVVDATGYEEILDVRIGFRKEDYDKAGDAVRNPLKEIYSIVEVDPYSNNLVNPNDPILGYYNGTDGVLNKVIHYFTTKSFIPVPAEVKDLTFVTTVSEPDSIFWISYWDKDGKYIGYESTRPTYLSPDSRGYYIWNPKMKLNTAMIAVTLGATESDLNDVCVNFNHITDMVPYTDNFVVKESKLPIMEEDPYSDNVANPNRPILGYYDGTSGVFTPRNSGYYTVNRLIPVPAEVKDLTFVTTVSEPDSIFWISYWDKDGKYIGYESTRPTYLSPDSRGYYIWNPLIPQGTKYIRITLGATESDLNDVCVNFNHITDMVPYTDNFVVKEYKLPIMEEDPYYIVNFGDSIFGNFRPPVDISTFLANLKHCKTYNCGFGGCRMSKYGNTNWDPFSMQALADAIANNDWSSQNAVNVDSIDGMPAYFKDTRAMMQKIDFSKINVATIAYGTNDFTAGVELDGEDPNDVTTFGGALRHSIETLLNKFPNIMIYICSPTYRFWRTSSGDFNYDSDTHIVNEQKLIDFVEKTKEIAKEYHLPFIDNYYELGFNKYNKSEYFPSNDGTHPNEKGRKEIAKALAKHIR